MRLVSTSVFFNVSLYLPLSLPPSLSRSFILSQSRPLLVYSWCRVRVPFPICNKFRSSYSLTFDTSQYMLTMSRMGSRSKNDDLLCVLIQITHQRHVENKQNSHHFFGKKAFCVINKLFLLCVIFDVGICFSL